MVNLKDKIKLLIDNIINKVKQLILNIKQKILSQEYENLVINTDKAIAILGYAPSIQITCGMNQVGNSPFVYIPMSEVYESLSTIDSLIKAANSSKGVDLQSVLIGTNNSLNMLINKVEEIIKEPMKYIKDISLNNIKPKKALSDILNAQQLNLKSVIAWKNGITGVIDRIPKSDKIETILINIMNNKMIEYMNGIIKLSNLQSKQYIQGLRKIISDAKIAKKASIKMESTYDIMYDSIIHM